MTSIVGKKQDGKTYYYAVESARVDGKPRIVSQQYLGSADEVMAKISGAGAGGVPVRSAHHRFGDVAAVWGVLERLGVAQIIDDVVAGAAPVKGVSVGRFLVIAALNRVVAPCSKAQISNWWVRTAGPRFTRISAAKLDHRRFWDAMNQISAEHLTEISSRVAAKIVAEYGVDTSSVALDMTNFATWVDSTNDAAPLLARGRSKQKRSDLRLLGLGLVVTRDGGIPLAWHAYRGNRPDVSVFTQTLDALTASYRLIAGAAEPPDSKATDSPARNTKSNDGLTVVFDAGQNSAANFTYLTGTGAKYVGSTPPSDHQDLLKVPASNYQLVTGFDGLTAYESAKTIYGQPQRVVMTHSPTLHAAQSHGFDQTLTKAAGQLDELAATLARGRTRSTREQLTARIDRITHNTWVTEVLAVTLTGNSPKEFRLTHQIKKTARTVLEKRVFGKRILITNQDDWATAEIITAYRSQSHVEDSFRQLKDPHIVSFSPMHHWTDDHIRVHTFTCVLALQAAHLMTRTAAQSGIKLSTRKILDELSSIEETVLLYHDGAKGRPRAQRLLTDHSKTAAKLAKLFNLDTYAPTR